MRLTPLISSVLVLALSSSAFAQEWEEFFSKDERFSCNFPGKPLQITLTKENARVWIGFNDAKGAFNDNHLGKGRRHELDPLWIRVEVIRIVVD